MRCERRVVSPGLAAQPLEHQLLIHKGRVRAALEESGLHELEPLMTADPPTAQALARDMIARATQQPDGPDHRAIAAHAVSERLHFELSRWVGSDGCHALFARAIARAEKSFPVLESITLRWRTAPRLEGVTEAIQAHGAEAIASGLESMVATVIDLLERLVGNDIAMLLVKRSSQHPSASAGPDAGRNRKAMGGAS